MKLLEIARLHNLKAYQLANYLDVHISQIYKWNKEGIYEDNPHFQKLKEVLPELDSLGSNKKCNRGRKKKNMTLKESTLKEVQKEQKRKSDYPTIIIRKK